MATPKEIGNCAPDRIIPLEYQRIAHFSPRIVLDGMQKLIRDYMLALNNRDDSESHLKIQFLGAVGSLTRDITRVPGKQPATYRRDVVKTLGYLAFLGISEDELTLEALGKKAEEYEEETDPDWDKKEAGLDVIRPPQHIVFQAHISAAQKWQKRINVTEGIAHIVERDEELDEANKVCLRILDRLRKKFKRFPSIEEKREVAAKRMKERAEKSLRKRE